MSWTKTECAKFFGMTVAALDHWFLRGAPVERDHNGRISGCYVGDILAGGDSVVIHVSVHVNFFGSARAFVEIIDISSVARTFASIEDLIA